MNLDELTRTATDELLTHTAPDGAALFDELRRTRTRRGLSRAAGVVLALLLMVGGVAWARSDVRDDTPSRPGGSGRVSNGAIATNSDQSVFLLVRGPLDDLSQASAPYSMVQFSRDGTELFYEERSITGQRSGELIALNLASGARRPLTRCPEDSCFLAQLSPDGLQLAVPTKIGGVNGISVHTLDSGTSKFLPTGDLALAWPRWSPDGKTLVGSTARGLSLLPADGGQLTLVHPYPPGSTNAGLPASWSPDGSTIAFIEPRPAPGSGPETSYALMTVRRDGSSPHRLRTLGTCYCIGISPPTVAWSPDGTKLAVAVNSSQSATATSSRGLFSVEPDGTHWTKIGSGKYDGAGTGLAWQPIPQP